MKSPKISIVIPSFNKVRYIEATLLSVLNQDYTNYEILVEDGGSTDGTLEVIKTYARKFPERIKWESFSDKGQLDAINRGFGKCSGDILAFINADDMYEYYSFKYVVDAYIKSPESLWFVGSGRIVNDKGREIVSLVSVYKRFLLAVNSFKLLQVVNYIVQPSVFLNRKAYEKFGSFTGTKDFVTEYEMWLRLGANSMPITIDKSLSIFRIEPASKTKRLFKKLIQEDERIVMSSTNDIIILSLHKLHNLLRIVINNLI